MELFAETVVLGGLMLVAGLWFLEAEAGGTLGWFGGAAFALAGALAIAAGIWMELDL